MARLAAVLVCLSALLAAACGGSGDEPGAGGRASGPARAPQPATQSPEEREAEADAVAQNLGRGAFCYTIGTIRYRGERRALYQCEFETGPVHCYVRLAGKPHEVDEFLSRRGASETLEESSVEILGCLDD